MQPLSTYVVRGFAFIVRKTGTPDPATGPNVSYIWLVLRPIATLGVEHPKKPKTS